MFKRSGGILKFGNSSGHERRRRLEYQAAKHGVSPEQLLQEKKNKIARWQSEREDLKLVRCCNCGHRGHNFEWCPFALPYFLSQRDRFRGKGGQWRPEEPALCLTESERSKLNKHFSILSMNLFASNSANQSTSVIPVICDEPRL